MAHPLKFNTIGCTDASSMPRSKSNSRIGQSVEPSTLLTSMLGKAVLLASLVAVLSQYTDALPVMVVEISQGNRFSSFPAHTIFVAPFYWWDFPVQNI